MQLKPFPEVLQHKALLSCYTLIALLQTKNVYIKYPQTVLSPSCLGKHRAASSMTVKTAIFCDILYSWQIKVNVLTRSAYILHKAASFSSGVDRVFRACINKSTSLPTKTKHTQSSFKKCISFLHFKTCDPHLRLSSSKTSSITIAIVQKYTKHLQLRQHILVYYYLPNPFRSKLLSEARSSSPTRGSIWQSSRPGVSPLSSCIQQLLIMAPKSSMLSEHGLSEFGGELLPSTSPRAATSISHSAVVASIILPQN